VRVSVYQIPEKFGQVPDRVRVLCRGLHDSIFPAITTRRMAITVLSLDRDHLATNPAIVQTFSGSSVPAALLAR
jgi:hypothetical protein